MKQKSVCLFALLVFSLLMPFGPHAFGLTVNYQYDDLYRLTAVVRSDGSVTEYQYDAVGNRLSMITTALLKGDLNGDNSVNLADTIMSLQITSGITPNQPVFSSAEVSGDGKIGLPESIYILQKVAGVR